MRDLTRDLGSLTQLNMIDKMELEDLLIPHLGEGVATPSNSMTDPVGTLLYNARHLAETCDSDPRQLARKQVRTTLRKIDEFRQYGIPKAALLMKNYVRSGIWPFAESEIPIKVDRHVLRINLGSGTINIEPHIEVLKKDRVLSVALGNVKDQLIRMEHYTPEDFEEERVRMVRGDKFIPDLTETYLRITKRDGLSAIDLDDAFWAIGAYLCRENNKIDCDHYCPIHCDIRHPSDNNAVYFFIDLDKRKNQNHLFED